MEQTRERAERYLIVHWALPEQKRTALKAFQLTDTYSEAHPPKGLYERGVYGIDLYEYELEEAKRSSNVVDILRLSDFGTGVAEEADEDEPEPVEEFALAEAAAPRFANRAPRLGPVLNQDGTPACTGCQARNFLNTEPVMTKPDQGPSWREIYDENRKRDAIPGTQHKGSTVYASIKTLAAHGYVRLGDAQRLASYDAIVRWKRNVGPVLQTVPWYEGMYVSDDRGLLRTTGRIRAIHCLLDLWVDDRGRDWWFNSWGPRHANNGVGYLPKEDKRKVMQHPMFRAYGVRQLSPGH